MSDAAPMLAVVGHPNKGKSSIVATLAHDVSVRISPLPGTTTRTRHFPMRVDGELLYTLADTPGFQRARRALVWLEERDVPLDAREQAVRDFVRAHESGTEFSDECELLRPIVDGAGILYVVDGSKPYGAEYEAEMEILRWTGRPRMALVNPIASATHVDAWRAALGQYFNVVRVFDAMGADFSRQVALLRVFGELDESWAPAFAQAVSVLERDRARRHALAAGAIADALGAMLSLRAKVDVAVGTDFDAASARLQHGYRDQLRELERRSRRAVERAYDHDGIERHEAGTDLLDQDLFDERSWTLFGLTPAQLGFTGALGGALAGGGVDLALGGASLMLGSAIGAALGAASAWLGGSQIAQLKLGEETGLGGMRITVGPVKDLNFPYVVLGRALHHQRLVAARTHARRDPLHIDPQDAARWAQRLHEAPRRQLQRSFTRLRDGDEDAVDELRGLLGELVPAVDEVPVDVPRA
jgi:hypothetical protein